jgi:hypothetical protein
MRLVRVGSFVVAVALLAGCGSGHTAARRNAVNAYFDNVDHAEAKLIAATGEIDGAFHAFSLTGNKPQEVSKLVRARSEIDSALHGVRAIDPPAEAKPLHADLIRLLALQSEIAGELVSATRYIPQFDRTVRPLRAASVTLSHDFAQTSKAKTTSPAAVLSDLSAAFATYQASLASVLRKLDGLSAPPALHATFASEQRILQRSITLSATVVAALKRKDVPAANAAIRTLLEVNGQANAAAAQKAEAAAAHVYDARLVAIARLRTTIAVKRQQLQQSLG